MSSGSGITHFEYNKSQNNTLNCIQLEIKPKSTDEKPRSKVLNLTSKKNLLQNIISPKNKETTSSSMYQDFYFYYGFFNEDFKEKYRVKNPKSGLLILNVSGEIQVNDQKLQDKDTLVIRNSSTITIVSKKQSKFFLIEL
jgi:redox-sensitive bicupin YhaK (pirin superfamily)